MPTKTTHALNEHNSSYWKMLSFWQDALALKEPLQGGGNETLGSYLNRYAKEDPQEWSERLKRLAQINFCDLIVDQYCSMLFSTSLVFRSEKYQPQVDRFVERCNLQGDSLQDYAREVIFPSALTYGNVDVFVDLPALNPSDNSGGRILSLADQRAQGLDSPYCYTVPPLNRTNWKLDDASNYVEYISSDVLDTQIQASMQIKDRLQYNWWTPDKVQVYDNDGVVISERPNPFGFIPVTTVMPWPSMRFYNDRIGLSLIRDVIPLQKMVLNLVSLIFDFHEAVNFAHRVLIQDTEGGNDVPAEGELAEMGNHRAFALQGAKSRFEIVTPDAGGVESMCRFLDQVIEMIYRSVSLTSDSNTNKTHQTQATIRGNHAQLFNRLNRIAKYGEKSMRQLVEMALRVQGIDPYEAKVTVTWGTNFSFDSFITNIEQLVQLRQALTGGMSPTAEAEFGKKIIEPELYNSGKLADIFGEFDKYVERAEKQIKQVQTMATQAVAAGAQAAKPPTLQQENTQVSAAAKVDAASD